LKSLLLAEVSTVADFTQQRAKKAYSLVNDHAVLDDRLFQQNRPIAAHRLTLRIGVPTVVT
jgi:hypothetical protein